MRCCALPQRKEKTSQRKFVVPRKTLFLLLIFFLAGAAIFVIRQKADLPRASLSGQKLDFNQALGRPAPDFSLPDIAGQEHRLEDHRGQIVVLFFNEGAMCYPACWDQIRALAEDPRFNSSQVLAFSIVVDQPSDWQRIIAQAPAFASAKILFDPERKASLAYDVLSRPSSMHPPSPMHPAGYPGHTYFIIDRQGVIGYALDDPNMGLQNDRLFAEVSKL